jgi:hypothetical protein
MQRQYFRYTYKGESKMFLLMPEEYSLYTNEYWGTRTIQDRFENATGRREGITNIALILELL